MNQSKRFCLALFSLLLGISSLWATATIYPTSDILYRPKYQTDHWVWNDNTYPKLSTTEGATIFECKWSSRMFAIQQYEIPNFANVKTLKLTLATTDNTKYDLSVWDFPYEFPVSTSDDATKRQQFVANVGTVTGVAVGTTTGSFHNILDTAKYTNDAWTFSIDASKLTPVSYKADGTTAVVNLLITTMFPNQQFAGKYSSNNSANAENKRPSLVVTEQLQDLSLPVNEYNYRFEADGSKWKYKTKTTGASATEMELNYNKNFVAVEQFYIKDFDKSKIYNLKLYIKNAYSAQAYNFQDYKHDTITATYLKQEVEKIVGITMGATSGTANNPISSCSRNSSADLTLTIPGSSLNVLYTDSRGYSVVNLLLTNISNDLLSNKSLKIYTSSSTDDKKPVWAFAGYANVYNKVQNKQYNTLSDAETAAVAGDTLCVNNDITLTARQDIDVAITLIGRTPQTKILRGTDLDNLLLLTKANVTIQDITLDGQSVSRSKNGIECGSNSKLTLKGVTMQNFAPTTEYADVMVTGDGVILTGENDIPNGIKLNKNKRVQTTNATISTPISLILASDYVSDYVAVLTCSDPTLFTVTCLDGKDWGLYCKPTKNELNAIQYADSITLDESADNATKIVAYKGHPTVITLTRTIAGSETAYSTFCVPFETTKDELGAAEVLAFTGATISGEEAILNFEDAETLEAGKPYLVRFASDKTNPVFNGKTITAATPGKYGDSNYEFTGLYSKTKITTDQTKDLMYLGANNQLYWAGANCTINGLRGYFQAVSAPAVAARRISIDRGAVTSLKENAESKKQNAKCLKDGQLIIVRDGKTYNAQGQIIK